MIIINLIYSGHRANIQQTLYCRTLQSVVNSIGDLQVNVNVGGHVWQHIGDLQQPPAGAVPGDTQLHKTLFDDIADFYKAWNNLYYYYYAPCDKNSATNVDEDCIYATTLGISSAIECTAVNANDICTQGTYFVPYTVKFFYYRYNSNSNWILRTAYPSVHKCD